jgi:CRP-like cAMP-binding protein
MLRSTFPRARDRSLERLVAEYRPLTQGKGVAPAALFDGREVSLILCGQVAAVQTAPDGRVSYLGVLGPGTLLGLPAVDGDGPTVDIEPLETASLAVWPASLVRNIAVRDTGLLVDIVDLLARRVRLSLRLLEQQTFAPARARLASFFIGNERLVFAHGSPLRRRQLAALAGISVEMLGRILRRWEGDGIIRRRGLRSLTLLDRDRLEDEASVAELFAPRAERSAVD